jgi:DNA invertase Pin-like site-specific DNA recombinase
MKAAVYARVSTFDKGQNPETQLMPLRAFCERAGWEYEEFVDHGSGLDEKRPAYNEMLLRIRRREFDALVIWKLSRLSRSLPQLIGTVHGELRPRNIQLVSLTEALDTTTPLGHLVFYFLGALAEFEHDIISEGVKAGMARSKAQGHRIGRKRVKVDYQRLLDAYQSAGTVRGAARILGISPGVAWDRLNEKGDLTDDLAGD